MTVLAPMGDSPVMWGKCFWSRHVKSFPGNTKAGNTEAIDSYKLKMSGVMEFCCWRLYVLTCPITLASNKRSSESAREHLELKGIIVAYKWWNRGTRGGSNIPKIEDLHFIRDSGFWRITVLPLPILSGVE